MSATPYFEAIAVEAWLGSRPVFQDLTLTLRLGEPTVLLGPNGAGKSALIHLISRSLYPVVKPGSALRLFGNSTVNLWDLRQRIGFVSSALQASYIPSVPAEDVVLSGVFGSVGLGRPQQPTGQQRAQALQQLEQLGLPHLQGRPFGECSDGQRRRLLLGRALIHQPEVLVLDEPINGLDFKAKTSADDHSPAINFESISQCLLRVDPVLDRHIRKVGTPGFPGGWVNGIGSGAAITAA